MPISHLLLVLLVAVIWGLNFIFVKLSLEEVSPLLLCAVRFLLASIPAIFFIKPPAIPFRTVASYGIVMFAMQFSLIFIGMKAGMPPGMASLIMQVQVFFSLFFAALFLAELPSIWQMVGAFVSFTGIGLVAMHFDNHITWVGFICILMAALVWGVGNLMTKKSGKVNMISLVVWGSFFAFIPTAMLALVFEGTSSMVESYQHLTWVGVLSTLYIVCFSTWIGYGLWGWLLSRYPVGLIVPFTLLVPIVAMLSSVLVLGEPFAWWKLGSGLLVIGGLCINLLGASFFVARMTPPVVALSEPMNESEE